MKTNMTLCGCFGVDVIICCHRTVCGMHVFRFCTLCVSRYLFQEDLSYWGYFSGKRGKKERKRKGMKKRGKKCSSTGSFSTLTHQLMSAARTWENRPCLPSSLPLQAWGSAEWSGWSCLNKVSSGRKKKTEKNTKKKLGQQEQESMLLLNYAVFAL